jgi:predicted nuclease of predicted toxin-antitoxin system
LLEICRGRYFKTYLFERMKLLLDQNISYKAIKLLSDVYEDIAQVGRLGMSQIDDAMIWQFARTHNYTMVTFDDYFEERNILSHTPIKVIWLRCQNTSTANVTRLLLENAEKIHQFYEDNAFSCIELED